MKLIKEYIINFFKPFLTSKTLFRLMLFISQVIPLLFFYLAFLGDSLGSKVLKGILFLLLIALIDSFMSFISKHIDFRIKKYINLKKKNKIESKVKFIKHEKENLVIILIHTIDSSKLEKMKKLNINTKKYEFKLKEIDKYIKENENIRYTDPYNDKIAIIYAQLCRQKILLNKEYNKLKNSKKT